MKLSRFLPLVVGSAAAGMVVSGASPVNALTWTADNVTFSNNGTLTGSFDYDASTISYSNINLTASFPAFSFSTIFSNSSLIGGDGTRLDLENSDGLLSLIFSPSLTNGGGTVAVGGAIFTGVAPGSPINGGSFSSTSAAVPFDIPGGATIPTVGSLFALALMRKAKKRMALKTIKSATSS